MIGGIGNALSGSMLTAGGGGGGMNQVCGNNYPTPEWQQAQFGQGILSGGHNNPQGAQQAWNEELARQHIAITQAQMLGIKRKAKRQRLLLLCA